VMTVGTMHTCNLSSLAYCTIAVLIMMITTGAYTVGTISGRKHNGHDGGAALLNLIKAQLWSCINRSTLTFVESDQCIT